MLNMPRGQTFGVDLTELEALETPKDTRATGKARTAYELVDTGHVTGFGSAFRSMTAHVFGGLGFPNNEDVLEARRGIGYYHTAISQSNCHNPLDSLKLSVSGFLRHLI